MDFKARYNRNTFVDFFSASLLPEDFEAAAETVESDFKSKYFQSITYLGQSPSLDLNVYEIRHSSEKDARVGLSRDAFKLVSRYGANNALILFVPENPDNFRLSLVTIEPKLDTKGVKILKEYSNPRRYSFVLGDDAKTHTPEQYLIALGRITDNADLTKRFSVEVVNKEFYGQIAEMFSKLVGGQRKKGNRTVDYQRQLVLPSVSADHDQKYKEFAVRLIGRTVFCWFLKKKKSDKGVPLIHNDVLSRFAADYTSNFYHARVEPLFFEVLNTSMEKRKPGYKKDPFDKIPFLNGGLFEPHLDDFYKVNQVTGTSEYQNTLKIPDDWWKELLDILETYNFTIDENTSIDIDLSVDPEMLGRIFENLLAEINPETGDTARKATGSYYTPRPIVEYMVDQSIKQYLVTKTALDETKFDTLLDYSNEASGLSGAEEKTVIEALNAIKILDPACGSGAFPMGMLQKMLLILQKVDHNAQNSVQQILNEITDPIKRELIKRKLEAAQVLDDVDFDDYARKLNVIQRSIYGVDIQPIATDISKLRFFLSLVVDEVIQDEAPNRGIEPLPNLEFKFVCANTLIPLPEADNFERMFGDAELVSGLENIRTRYFTASNDDKPALKKEFEDLQKKLYDFLNQHGAGANITKSRFGLLATWKPFSDEAATWFDSKWMFGVVSGFDIVIGNPPYISYYSNTGNSLSKDEKKFFVDNYDCVLKANDRINSMNLMSEKGLKLLNHLGHISFITNKTIAVLPSYIEVRKYILTNSKIEYFVTDLDPFEAIVDCVIFGLKKEKCLDYELKWYKGGIDDFTQKNISPFFSNKNLEFHFSSYQNVLKNIEKAKNVLEDLLLINRGVNIGGCFDDFLSDSKKSNNYWKYLSGTRNIEKYYFKWYDNDGYMKFDLKREEELRIQGKTLVLGNQDRYKHERLFIPESGQNIMAAYCNEEYYSAYGIMVATNANQKYSIKYSCALLNSKLLTFYAIEKEILRKGKKATPHIGVKGLNSIPVHLCNKSIEKLFSSLVDKIVTAKKQDLYSESSIYENQIDLMVYKLYELSYDEIKIIDPVIEKLISSEDYERLDIEGLAKYIIA